MSSAKAEAVKSRLSHTPKPAVNWDGGLSSGITLIDLAMSGRPGVALLPGYVYLFVGESHSGKTWIMKQIMAEATLNAFYRDYRIILDNPGRGDLAGTTMFFGPELARRLEAPYADGASTTVEEFYDAVERVRRRGKPFIYGLDDDDSLIPEAQLKKDATAAAARLKKRGKDAAADPSGEQGEGQEKKDKVAGTYGLDKPKYHSSHLRCAHNAAGELGGILILIKQTRDNIDMFAREKETHNGGRGLKFFATNTVWFTIVRELRRKVNGRPRVIGECFQVHVKKNRQWGRDRTVNINFYPSHGIDEVGTNIQYLVDERHWAESGKEEYTKVVTAPEFAFEGLKEDLALQINAGGEEATRLLASLVTDKWSEIEAGCNVVRVNKYAGGTK